MQIEKGADKIIKTIRVSITDKPGYLGRLATAIGEQGGNIGFIKTIKLGVIHNTRDIEVYVDNDEHLERILEAVGGIEGLLIEDVIDQVQEVHRGGKISVKSMVKLESISDVRKIYTPGVANICRLIHQNPEAADEYTSINNTVAIVTNGTAILGLGDIGPVAGMPVMEGKAVLLDKLVGISGVPILLDTRDIDEIVNTVIHISPGFGAIKLEDIAAPECFEIERRLDEALPIPVMHDDQHGTAVVVLSALLNACKYCGKLMKNDVIGLIGLGAAGMGIAKLLSSYSAKMLIGTDIKNSAIEIFQKMGGKPTTLEDIMKRADIVIATTGVPNLIKPETVRKGQIILALSNPIPEIKPDDALNAGAAFASDGKGVNNALGFPGIFRGALNARATTINNHMKIAAAKTIAKFAEKGELVPPLLNIEVHQTVAKEVERAAFESGVIRRRR